jgi:hypothetical protein
MMDWEQRKKLVPGLSIIVSMSPLGPPAWPGPPGEAQQSNANRPFGREAGIIEPAPVEEFGRAVRTGRPSQRRNRIDDGSQFAF